MPDSLGPETYNSVLARARASHEEYLDTFESMFLGFSFDAVVQSGLYVHVLLSIVFDLSPVRVTEIASRLLRQYEAILIVYDNFQDRNVLANNLPESVYRTLLRLVDRREHLRELVARKAASNA